MVFTSTEASSVLAARFEALKLTLVERPPIVPPVAIPRFLISNVIDDRIAAVCACTVPEQRAETINIKTNTFFIVAYLLFTRWRCSRRRASRSAWWRSARSVVFFGHFYFGVGRAAMAGIAINTCGHHHAERILLGLEKFLVDLVHHQVHMACRGLFRFSITREIHFTGSLITCMAKITMYAQRSCPHIHLVIQYPVGYIFRENLNVHQFRLFPLLLRQ